MGIVSRVAKPNGSTEWADPDVLFADDLEGDITNIIDEINGNLGNANIDASANIAISKLAQTPAALDADIVDDYATNAAEYHTNTTPGDTASPSLPTNLEEELERLRFVLKSHGIGSGTLLQTSTEAAWYEPPALGPNLVKNPNFIDNIAGDGTPPTGWAETVTPGTIETFNLASSDRAEGVGRGIHVVAGAGANEGITQTITGLKASQKYLVEARVKVTATGDVKLQTSGAIGSGSYQDLDITGTADPATWETLSGIVQADATGTDIDIEIESAAAADEFWVAYASFRELRDATSTRGGSFIQTATSTSAVEATIKSDTTLSVVVPSDNYVIIATADVKLTTDGGGLCEGGIEEDVAGGGFSSVAAGQTNGTSTRDGDTHVHYTRTFPTPGTIYQYRIATADGDSRTHRLTVMALQLGAGGV